jgi:uncharacterized protein
LRIFFRAVLVVAAGAFVIDATRLPTRQVSVGLAVAGIHLYQTALSPRLGSPGTACRFTPTCSHYAEAVLTRDGILKGGWLTLRRIARCGPWTRPGTSDPP